MSKNISIKVGGVSRNFSNVPKIQTEEAITGDNIDWIPEDEANDYAVTESARITENGTYHPSSGKCGFNEVVVNVQGGGGTLIEKNITQNGEYYAMDDNADGYSKVSVNVAGASNIMTSEEWAALTYEEKVAAGLTIIRDNDGDFQGIWYNYAYNLPIDIVAEFYGRSSKTFTVNSDYFHFITWKGNWKNVQRNRYANSQVDFSDITWLTSETGSITSVYGDNLSNAQTTILNNMQYGDNPSLSFRQTPYQVDCYGVVIGVRPQSNIAILAEYYDSSSHSYTLSEDYDALIVLGTKSSDISADSINVLTGDYSTGKAGDEFAINSAQVPMAQIFANVKANSVVTTYPLPSDNDMGSVIIGVNYI